MKLYDGGIALAVGIIAVVYFGEWVVNKIDPPPKQCAYAEVLEGGVTKTEWKDCEINE